MRGTQHAPDAGGVPPRDWTRTIFLRSSDEDYTLTTRARLLERIRVTLAGRAGEEALLDGGATTYSTTDLKVRFWTDVASQKASMNPAARGRRRCSIPAPPPTPPTT